MAKAFKSLVELKESKQQATANLAEQVEAMKEAGFDVSKVNIKEETEEERELNYGGYNWFKIQRIPSKGKWYPPGTSFYGKSLSLLDLKLLATMNANNNDTIAATVIARNIRTKGIDVKDILVADMKYLIFWLRNQTFSNSFYEYKYDCPECHKEVNAKFELGKLEVLEPDPAMQDTLKLGTGQVLKLSPTTARDNDFVDEILKVNNPEKSGMDESMIRSFQCVRTINDAPATIIGVNMLMNENPADFGTLMRLATAIDDWGPQPRVESTCSCGRLTKVSLTFLPDFFLPGYLG